MSYRPGHPGQVPGTEIFYSIRGNILRPGSVMAVNNERSRVRPDPRIETSVFVTAEQRGTADDETAEPHAVEGGDGGQAIARQPTPRFA